METAFSFFANAVTFGMDWREQRKRAFLRTFCC
jgi:hypothetical protein